MTLFQSALDHVLYHRVLRQVPFMPMARFRGAFHVSDDSGDDGHGSAEGYAGPSRHCFVIQQEIGDFLDNRAR